MRCFDFTLWQHVFTRVIASKMFSYIYLLPSCFPSNSYILREKSLPYHAWLWGKCVFKIISRNIQKGGTLLYRLCMLPSGGQLLRSKNRKALHLTHSDFPVWKEIMYVDTLWFRNGNKKVLFFNFIVLNFNIFWENLYFLYFCLEILVNVFIFLRIAVMISIKLDIMSVKIGLFVLADGFSIYFR